MAAYLAAMKYRQEQFTQVVRELASLPANRHCFDCGQRGPTYVNMTIGSYVCTTCSGLLRGLNPPHRIKSIAMASFVAEEIDFLKATGNELCQQAYFAMFDGRFTIPESSSVNPQAVRDFLTLKYEKRLWFTTPSAQQHNEARRKQSEALERMQNEQSGVRMRSASASQAPRSIARPNSQTDAPNVSQFYFDSRSSFSAKVQQLIAELLSIKSIHLLRF
jgi:Arf-GAP domain and FG repeat-containing protein 1